jgi:hypothetical protein
VIDDAERLDAALNRQRIGARVEDVSPQVRALVDLALEISDAYASWKLAPADHDRLYAESLLRLEATLRRHRHLWQRVPGGPRGAMIGGAAAATVVAAAIGVGVILERRSGHSRPRLPLVA